MTYCVEEYKANDIWRYLSMFLEFGSSDPRGSFPVWELISGINTSNEPTKNMEKKKVLLSYVQLL